MGKLEKPNDNLVISSLHIVFVFIEGEEEIRKRVTT